MTMIRAALRRQQHNPLVRAARTLVDLFVLCGTVAAELAWGVTLTMVASLLLYR
jgi:hypothetical protein